MKTYKRNIYFIITSFFIFLPPLHSHAKANELRPDIKKPPAYAKELADIFERKVLRVAMYKRDTPPFYFVNENNELTGVDVEIIKGFARKLGLDVQFIRHAQTLDEVVDLVAMGEADLAICKLSITLSRATKVLFTEPYIKLHKGL